jgi:hypothetical protein
VIISTQSVQLLDYFDTHDVIVVDRRGRNLGIHSSIGREFVRVAGRLQPRGAVGEERAGWGTPLMCHLYLYVEGQTEQTFAADVLKPHLAQHGVYLMGEVLVQSARKKGKIYRGGGRTYVTFRTGLQNLFKLHNRPDVWFSSMIDLYALPNNFPRVGRSRKTAFRPPKPGRSARRVARCGCRPPTVYSLHPTARVRGAALRESERTQFILSRQRRCDHCTPSYFRRSRLPRIDR